MFPRITYEISGMLQINLVSSQNLVSLMQKKEFMDYGACRLFFEGLPKAVASPSHYIRFDEYIQIHC